MLQCVIGDRCQAVLYVRQRYCTVVLSKDVQRFLQLVGIVQGGDDLVCHLVVNVSVFALGVMGDNVLPRLIGHNFFEVCLYLGTNMCPVVPLAGDFVRIGQDQPHIVRSLHDCLKLCGTGGVISVGNAHHQIPAVCDVSTAPEGFVVGVCHDHQVGNAGQIQFCQPFVSQRCNIIGTCRGDCTAKPEQSAHQCQNRQKHGENFLKLDVM